MSVAGDLLKDEFNNLPRNVRSGITFLIVGAVVGIAGILFDNRVRAAETKAAEATTKAEMLEKKIDTITSDVNTIKERGAANQERLRNLEAGQLRIQESTDRLDSKLDRLLDAEIRRQRAER